MSLPNRMNQASQRMQQTASTGGGCLASKLPVSVTHVCCPRHVQATGWLHKADVKTALAGFFKGKKASAGT